MANEIIKRLHEIEQTQEVRIQYACESSSRAWGFPSADSDYDVRFIYLHRTDWYLSVEAKRDVIEYRLEQNLDINGWDLKKALRLFRQSNPPLLEWLGSPIVYLEKTSTSAKLRELAKRQAGALNHKFMCGKDGLCGIGFMFCPWNGRFDRIE
jgi:uncharacterized protein